jgi:hypothetical protein
MQFQVFSHRYFHHGELCDVRQVRWSQLRHNVLFLCQAHQQPLFPACWVWSTSTLLRLNLVRNLLVEFQMSLRLKDEQHRLRLEPRSLR